MDPQIFTPERLAALISRSVDNSIIITDRAGRIDWVNAGFQRLTGYSLAEVKGTRAEALRLGSKTGLSDAALLENCIRERKSASYEMVNFSKRGSEYWVSTTITPCFDENTGEFLHFIVVECDISNRVNTEFDLRCSQVMAEEARKAQEIFLANMSHEIRTPLNSILGFAGLLWNTKLTAEQRDYLDSIRSSGENLLAVITDILDFARISSGRMTLSEGTFNPENTIREVLKTFTVKAAQGGNALQFNSGNGLQAWLKGDENKFRQILVNLVSNALKFTRNGKVVVEASSAAEGDGMVTLEVTVRDTGIGIPENKISAIFERFGQAAANDAKHGTGLGLTIVKSLADLMGGSIRVQSRQNEGSEFSVGLKFQMAQPPVEPETFPESGDFTGLKVLLAEDNTVNRKFAKKLLGDKKISVTGVCNGQEAVDACAAEKFDLVLMDIQMPSMDGFEAIRKIRQLTNDMRGVPIIAMTAHAAEDVMKKCLAAGASDYITKPIRIQKLFASIAKHAGKSPGAGIRVTDLALIRESASGDWHFVVDLLESLAGEISEYRETMDQALQANDWNRVKRVSHKMQSSAQLLGMAGEAKQLSEIEGRSDSMEGRKEIPALNSSLRAAFGKALEEISTELFSIQKQSLHNSVN